MPSGANPTRVLGDAGAIASNAAQAFPLSDDPRRNWCISMENAERALQHVAMLDKERKPTGEYRYDGNVANRALELLGKQRGMFIDRHEVGQPNEFANWTDEELEAFIKSGTRPLGIVSGKTQH
jgi:hypothetical protein